jgi:hypothetical protein
VEKPVLDIHQSLQKLIGLHRQLMDVVRLEREALIEANLKAVHDVTVSKQALIEAIKISEFERQKHVAALSLLWKKPIRDLTISNIIILIQAREQKLAEQLRSDFNALTILIKRISDQNIDNQALVERSLEHVHNMKRNALGESAPKTDTYNPHGQKTNSGGSARLISREA